jgi:sensor c-di-GMP phosphodiesterase-like protein
VSGLGEGTEDKVIVSSTINLAKGLGMKAIAEGMGSTEQVARLREMGCEMAQGHYFSKPLPSEAVSVRLCARSPMMAQSPAETGQGSAPADNPHRSKKRNGVVMALGKPCG